jgi:hypothetical protein
LLLAAVSGTDQGDGISGLLVVVEKIPYCHLDRIIDEALDLKLPVEHIGVLTLWDGSMVADIVKILVGEETLIV